MHSAHYALYYSALRKCTISDTIYSICLFVELVILTICSVNYNTSVQLFKFRVASVKLCYNASGLLLLPLTVQDIINANRQ